MKFLLSFSLLAGVLSAQAPAPVPPGTKVTDVGKAPAQKPEDTEIDPNMVVATLNGRKITAGELERMVRATPAQTQKLYHTNPKLFLRNIAVMKLIQEEAEKNKLDQMSPYKEQLEFARMYTLVNAQATHMNVQVPVSHEDEKRHYQANLEKYREAKAKVIYISFGDPAKAEKGKKILSEAEAKAKAEDIVREGRAGADFVKLVKENSEEPGSREKSGDLGLPVRSTTTQVPEAARKVILATKAGEITDPVRLDNGFYIFRIEANGVLPYEQVRGDIFQELKQAGLVKWQREVESRASVTFENEEFFKPKQAPKP